MSRIRRCTINKKVFDAKKAMFELAHGSSNVICPLIKKNDIIEIVFRDKHIEKGVAHRDGLAVTHTRKKDEYFNT